MLNETGKVEQAATNSDDGPLRQVRSSDREEGRSVPVLPRDLRLFQSGRRHLRHHPIDLQGERTGRISATYLLGWMGRELVGNHFLYNNNNIFV